MFERLREQARDVAGPPGEPAFAVAGELERKAATVALLRYFGEDDARAGVTLVVDGEHVGRLARADVLSVIADGTRGAGYGSSAGSVLPGLASYELVRLRCPVAGCAAPEQLRISFDEDHPPRCALHPAQALEPVR